MEYRREARFPIWHFHPECSRWPPDSFNIIIAQKLPSDFELCKECIALSERQNKQL